jgi:phage shock protein E|nr:rhodanese-like domain-containing protein [Moraxella osloensis]
MWLKNLIASIIGKKQLPNGALLVDARTPQEHQTGVISGSILLPLDQLPEQALTKLGNQQTPIVVYCASGVRAIAARRQLKRMGYLQVINGGGIQNVAESTGEPIIKLL